MKVLHIATFSLVGKEAKPQGQSARQKEKEKRRKEKKKEKRHRGERAVL